MNIIDKRKARLIEELKNKEYRDSYVSSNIDVGIAFQIRALRKQRELTQSDLAILSEMKQERISSLENPSNSPNISTLKKIAAAFEVGLVVRFVSFGDMLKRDLNLSLESLEIPSFGQDPYFKENNEDVETTADIQQYLKSSTEEASSNVIYLEDIINNNIFRHEILPPVTSSTDGEALAI